MYGGLVNEAKRTLAIVVPVGTTIDTSVALLVEFDPPFGSTFTTKLVDDIARTVKLRSTCAAGRYVAFPA